MMMTNGPARTRQGRCGAAQTNRAVAGGLQGAYASSEGGHRPRRFGERPADTRGGRRVFGRGRRKKWWTSGRWHVFDRVSPAQIRFPGNDDIVQHEVRLFRACNSARSGTSMSSATYYNAKLVLVVLGSLKSPLLRAPVKRHFQAETCVAKKPPLSFLPSFRPAFQAPRFVRVRAHFISR